MPMRFEANYGDPDLAFDPLVDEVFADLITLPISKCIFL